MIACIYFVLWVCRPRNKVHISLPESVEIHTDVHQFKCIMDLIVAPHLYYSRRACEDILQETAVAFCPPTPRMSLLALALLLCVLTSRSREFLALKSPWDTYSMLLPSLAQLWMPSLPPLVTVTRWRLKWSPQTWK